MPMMEEAAAQQPAAPAPRGDLSDMNTPASAGKGKQIADSYVRRSGGLNAPEEEATPEEQAELERAVGALGKVIYEDDATSQAIQDQLRPEEKIGSVVKASLLVINQLDQQLDLDEVIIPQFTQEVTDRMVDLYEQKTEEEFSDEEAQKVLGAAWEGVLDMFGMDEETYEEMTQGMSEQDIAGYEQQYKQQLG